MFGVVDLDAPEMRPMVINMKLSDGAWHRCFLDVGFAVWDRWPHLLDDDADGDEVRYVDYGRDSGLIGEILRSVDAKPLLGLDALTQLTVHFESGRFVRLCPTASGDPECGSFLTIGDAPTESSPISGA